MRICIDSCVFIRGLQDGNSASARLLDLVGYDCTLLVPRLVAQEVTRNLGTPGQVTRFYRLFYEHDIALIVDEPVPRALVDEYVRRGLPEKADAYIGAFSEWMQVRYLITDNRHFLRDLHTDAYELLDAEGFLTRWDENSL